MRPWPGDRRLGAPLSLLFALFATLLVRTAWLCDDAYITFRVVDNFWHGYGLRWNVVDRVQSFTHPLWMLLMAAGYGVTREIYYTSLAVSCALSLATAIVVLRASLSRAHALLALLALTLSKAFLDYSTSGLENPLQHLLLALFCWEYFARGREESAFFHLSLLAGLLALNRLDSLLLIGPALAFAALRSPSERRLRSLVLGFLPLAAWLLFSFFYYGFALPNTAYAKLNTGASGSELLAQGFYYLFNSLSLDPLTLVVVLLALGLPLLHGPESALPLGIGIALHLAYIVRIGGDFMSGRFLSAPLLASVLLLSRVPMPMGALPLGLSFLTMGAISLASPVPTLTATGFFFTDRWERRTLLDERGITDERAIYYRYTGLLVARRGEEMPIHRRAAQGRQLRAEGPSCLEHGQIGILGFYAGPEVHIYDANALTDAFLARLPAGPNWRIGHFYRIFPNGYQGSLCKGVNRIDDPELRKLYHKISLATRGPLLDGGRLAAVWDLNFGEARHLADAYFEVHARMQRASLAELEAPRQDGDDWALGARRFGARGIEVSLGGVRHARAVELSLDGNDTYKLQCLKLGVSLADVEIPPRVVEGGGLSVRKAALPPPAYYWGCDSLRVLPVTGDQNYSLGHVRLLDELSPAELREPPPGLREPPSPEPPGEGEEGKKD